MGKHLFVQAISKVLLGIALTGALLFLPAGTWDYWNAWLLMGILFVPMVCAGLVMLYKSPQLLEKRLRLKEGREQSLVVALSGVMFVAGFVLAGLNHRFSWLVLPDQVSWAAAGVFLLSYLLYAEVLRENAFLSRTVEIQEGQTVVDTGLYGVVRHPMYSATILLFLSMPLVLGSLPSFVLFFAYPALLVKRIRNEEALLEAELAGYVAYKEKVRYRLVPYLW